MFHVFTRATCDNEGNPYPQAPRRTLDTVQTEAEARKLCSDWNEPYDFRGKGKHKVFAEFERV